MAPFDSAAEHLKRLVAGIRLGAYGIVGFPSAGGIGAGTSNIDPYATEPTPDNEWVQTGPHLMIIVPDPALLEGIPTDPATGGPYVMWRGQLSTSTE